MMIKGFTITCNECNKQVTIKHVDDVNKGDIKVMVIMNGDILIYCERCNDNDMCRTVIM